MGQWTAQTRRQHRLSRWQFFFWFLFWFLQCPRHFHFDSPKAFHVACLLFFGDLKLFAVPVGQVDFDAVAVRNIDVGDFSPSILVSS